MTSDQLDLSTLTKTERVVRFIWAARWMIALFMGLYSVKAVFSVSTFGVLSLESQYVIYGISILITVILAFLQYWCVYHRAGTKWLIFTMSLSALSLGSLLLYKVQGSLYTVILPALLTFGSDFFMRRVNKKLCRTKTCSL